MVILVRVRVVLTLSQACDRYGMVDTNMRRELKWLRDRGDPAGQPVLLSNGRHPINDKAHVYDRDLLDKALARRLDRQENKVTRTTTSYGTWHNHTGEASLRGSIETALGADIGDFDVDAIEEEYRAAVEARLPDEVTLHGDEFYVVSGGDPQLDMRKIIEAVDFWEIVQRHAR